MSHNILKKKYNSDFTNLFKILYKESIKALKIGEVPVAALIYDPKKKKIISKAFNSNIKNFDPCSHAEVLAIKKACKKLETSRLDGYDLFCSLEPCLMCSSIIFQSKIRRIYFSVEEKKTGALINNLKLIFNHKYKKNIKIYYGFDEDKFLNLLKEFFKKKRR